MSGLIDLPDGPSGRNPVAAVSLAEQNGITPESYLVLFEDGAIGTKTGENSNLLFRQPPKSYDGSKYAMIFHSAKQLGKIECTINSGKRQYYFLCFSVVLSIAYFGVSLYYRINSQWPTFLVDATSGNVPGTLIILVFLLYSIPRLDFFDFSSGEISIYLVDTDPHIYPISSETMHTINSTLFLMLLFSFSPFFIGDLFCDILLVFAVGFTLISMITQRRINTKIIFKKNDFMTPEVGIIEFCNRVEVMMEEIEKKERNDQPLLNLLMDQESEKLEFKASLWTTYHGVSGELIEGQEKKNLDLQDSVLKTVAAFLNTNGGTLLIGIKDKSRSSGNEIAGVLGIESDFQWLKKGKRDTEGYSHSLLEIFQHALSNNAAPLPPYATITYPVYQNSIICRIDVQPLPRRVGQQCYAKTQTMGDEVFFVRSGDSTIPQSAQTQYEYIRHHFEGFSGENNKS